MEIIIRKKTCLIVKIVKIIKIVTVNIQKISIGIKRFLKTINVQEIKL